jgi:hopanoid biosynthesis associated protein HpnK
MPGCAPKAARIRLIVNADDFGRSESINAAVLEAHDRGILTSCSLMVGEAAAPAAVRAARERPGLAVGLHLTTLCGHAVLPPSTVPRLVDGSGRLPENPVRAGLRYSFDRAALAQLERELRAQFERFDEFGLPLSHVDGHLHMHLHPFIFDRVAALAEESGCRRLRIPRDDWWAYRREAGLRALAQAPLALIFAWLNRRAHRRLAGRGFVWATRVHGLFHTGRMDEGGLLALLRRLPPGDHEIYSHPDAGQERSDARGGQNELAALTSPAVRRLLEERGIHRITYRDLEATVCR